MTTIFWSITPLASSIFAIGSRVHSTTVPTTYNAELMPLNSQLDSLTTGFMTTAYNVVWLGQNLPGFTIKQSALLPFWVNHNELVTDPDQRWTSETMMYSATVSCNPAKVENTSEGITYSNSKGCVTSPGYLDDDGSVDPSIRFIGWYMDQHSDYALSEMGCPSEDFSHSFLLFWGTRRQGRFESTAIFCEPQYWSQKANVTVSTLDLSVSNITALEQPTPLSWTEFNISNFEYVIGTGAVVRSRRADVPDTMSTINSTSRMLKLGFEHGSVSGNMVGFAFGVKQLGLEDYLDVQTLATSFEEAYQLLFALAIRTLFTNGSDTPNFKPTVIERTRKTIFVVRTLTVLIESCLGVVTLFTFALGFMAWKRPSQLKCDPDSLREVMKLLRSNQLSGEFLKGPETSKERLQAKIDQGKLSLCVDGNQHPSYPQMQVARRRSDSPLTATKDLLFPTIPLEMRFPVAVVFISLLCAAIILVAVVSSSVRKQHGLAQPSTSPVVNQIVTNYGPVLLATILEPFWLLLNRMLCILKPFEELRRGDMAPSTSIHLKYTSLPPQLTLWRALKARHFLLVAVCAVGLSANILSVALGAFFTTDFDSRELPSTFTTQYLPMFFNNSIDAASADPFYVANANMTTGTSLPPWTSPTRSFLPFTTTGQNNTKVSRTVYKVTRQGFGIDVECVPVADPLRAVTTNFSASIVIPPKFAENRSLNCSYLPTLFPYGGQNLSMTALEDLSPLTAVDTQDSNICRRLFAVTFLRANLTVARDGVATDNSPYPPPTGNDVLSINTFSSLGLVCQPSLVVAPHSIVSDENGYIMDALQTGQHEEDIDPYFAPNFTVNDLLFTTSLIWYTAAYTGPWWHNDTFVDNWFPYFVKTLSKDTTLVDPLQPLPSVDVLAPVVEEVISRIFAITLSLNPSIFKQTPSNTSFVGSKLVTSERIFISRTAFVITITLLVFNVIVAILYYARRPKRVLRQMPTTVASLLELFDGSGLVDEMNEHDDVPRDWKLAYGHFRGTDGELKVGIERRPFVIPWGNK